MAAGDPQHEYQRRDVNPLRVQCPWCRAAVGQWCVMRGSNQRLRRSPFHPSRIEKAEEAQCV